jgi:heme-degrading monooxygenase HmoA
MEITRVFRADIRSDLVKEFEEKFAAVSVQVTESAAGNLSVTILKPTRWTANEYAMISTWNDEESLREFAGENWNQAVIPNGMDKYIKSCSVHHYESWY